MSTMKSVIAKFRKELRTTYQAQKNIMDVTDKYLNQLENAEAGGAGGIDYSTTEQDTGLKWIDGKTVYQKTVSIGTLPNTNQANVPHLISNIDSIIMCTGFATNGTSTLPLPYATNSDGANIGINCPDKTNITIFDGSDRSSFTGYVTLRYTKTA